MATATLEISNRTGTFSRVAKFSPIDSEKVSVRTYLRDTMLGNWTGEHGQSVTHSTAEARELWRSLKSQGYTRS